MNKDMENNHDKRERLNNFEMVHSRRLKYAMILRERNLHIRYGKNITIYCLQLTAFPHGGKRKPHDFQ